MNFIRFEDEYINMDHVVEAKVKNDKVYLTLTSTTDEGKARHITLSGEAATFVKDFLSANSKNTGAPKLAPKSDDSDAMELYPNARRLR